MSSPQSLPVAEISDRHRRYFAYMMLLLALVQVGLAVEKILPARQSLAEAMQIVGAVGMVAFLLRVAWWKLRNLSADVRHIYFDADGFLAGAMARAHVISWSVSFVFITMLATLDRTLADVPGFALLNMAVAAMAASFGIAFLWLARADDVGEVTGA